MQSHWTDLHSCVKSIECTLNGHLAPEAAAAEASVDVLDQILALKLRSTAQGYILMLIPTCIPASTSISRSMCVHLDVSPPSACLGLASIVHQIVGAQYIEMVWPVWNM